MKEAQEDKKRGEEIEVRNNAEAAAYQVERQIKLRPWRGHSCRRLALYLTDAKRRDKSRRGRHKCPRHEPVVFCESVSTMVYPRIRKECSMPVLSSERVESGLTTTQAPFIEQARSQGELFIHQPYDLYSPENHESGAACTRAAPTLG